MRIFQALFHHHDLGLVLLAAAICAFGAIAALSVATLAVAASASAFLLLCIVVASALVNQRVAFRRNGEAERFRALANGAFEGLIVHTEGTIVDANAAARTMLGLPEHAAGEALGDWFAFAPDFAAAGTPAPAGGPVERLLRRSDGTRFPAEICRRVMRMADGSEGEICAIRDLTARRHAEARNAHLALHDPLTELPNRRFFMELTQKAVFNAQRTGDGFALIAVGIDDLQLINDVHGQAAGDAVIRTFARRITTVVRDVDVAARVGGDEFVILQAGASQAKQTLALGVRVLEALQQPVQIGTAEVTVSASIGLALHPADGATVDELLRNAEVALHRARADGKAACRFFEPRMDAALVARRTVENGLRRAVAEDRLEVLYQPFVDIATREPLGFEALVRWPDPVLGTIMPNDFIPVAEDTGLIVPIGRFVLRRACMEAAQWPAPLRVAVNLSVVQFRRQGLVAAVREALAESGLPGDRLELEVTEALLLDHRAEPLKTLTALKALGVRIVMDDFGTGYSSLSHLQSFAFDKVKIDRAFLSGLPASSQNAPIVRAVAALGRSLNMTVVAEGVETDPQADMLQEIDCDELQGFLIARPMAESEVRGFLHGCRNAVAARTLRSAAAGG